MIAMFTPANPDYRARVETIFAAAPFIADLGIELHDCGPGWCETSLKLQPQHFQQNQVVHAGVQATLADHTAGAAAGTLMSAEQVVLTVEYKVQLLRAAQGEHLTCRAEVLRPGKQITAVESVVLAHPAEGAEGKLVAKLSATMALVTGR